MANQFQSLEWKRSSRHSRKITELESENAKLKHEHANLEPYWQQATKWETQAKDIHVVERQLEKAERDKWSYKGQLDELRRKVEANSTYQATGYENAAGPPRSPARGSREVEKQGGAIQATT